MAVRNFWIEAEIDGRKHKLKGGPRAKTGGFKLTVQQRSNGSITKAVSVEGKVSQCGESLGLVVKAGDKEIKRWTPR